MAGRPLVSIVLPYRNRVDVLERAVASVLEQTVGDFELILVDDASTDGSAGVVKGLSDPRIRALGTDTRRGAGGARNVGIDAARGRFLAFQDSDDSWLASKLELQLSAHQTLLDEGRPVAAIGCRWRYRGAPEDTAGLAVPAVQCFPADAVLAGCVSGIGTPMLLLDRERSNTSVRFDTTFPSLEERDYLFRSLGGARLGVVAQQLAIVQRGRSDHVANAGRGLAALELYLEKYASELNRSSRVREWFHYMAMREAVRCRELRCAIRHLRQAGSRARPRLWTEFGLGTTFGERGLAIASRLGVRPDYSDRCRAR
jgi:glycosyltransferase involved in cell wall biosynthesis